MILHHSLTSLLVSSLMSAAVLAAPLYDIIQSKDNGTNSLPDGSPGLSGSRALVSRSPPCPNGARMFPNNSCLPVETNASSASAHGTNVSSNQSGGDSLSISSTSGPLPSTASLRPRGEPSNTLRRVFCTPSFCSSSSVDQAKQQYAERDARWIRLYGALPTPKRSAADVLREVLSTQSSIRRPSVQSPPRSPKSAVAALSALLPTQLPTRSSAQPSARYPLAPPRAPAGPMTTVTAPTPPSDPTMIVTAPSSNLS